MEVWCWSFFPQTLQLCPYFIVVNSGGWQTWLMVTCSGVFSWLSVEAHSFVTCTAVICLKQQVHILVFLKLANFMSSMVPVLYFFPLLECVSIYTCQVISRYFPGIRLRGDVRNCIGSSCLLSSSGAQQEELS